MRAPTATPSSLKSASPKQARSGPVHHLNAWWTEIEIFLITGVTNARTEAANTSIKQLKRTGRGYRNAEPYKARILLGSAARRAA